MAWHASAKCMFRRIFCEQLLHAYVGGHFLCTCGINGVYVYGTTMTSHRLKLWTGGFVLGYLLCKCVPGAIFQRWESRWRLFTLKGRSCST